MFSMEYDPDHPFTPDPGLFEKFLRLSQKDEESVVRFAGRHGMLEVCPDHCRPFPHSPKDPWESSCESYRGRELASDWIRVADAVRAAILIGAKLQRKELPSADDWVPLLGEDGIDPRRGFRRKDFDPEAMEPQTIWVRRSIDGDWAVLGSRLNNWWSSSLPKPELRFLPKLTVEIDLRASSLWGLLVRELAFIVAKVEGFAVCAGCGELFSPKRRPAPGQRSWCGGAECRRVQFRLSKAAQRSRQKAVRRKTTSKGRS
jgi:hypothetical protein